jgi:hypothetical protein
MSLERVMNSILLIIILFTFEFASAANPNDCSEALRTLITGSRVLSYSGRSVENILLTSEVSDIIHNSFKGTQEQLLALFPKNLKPKVHKWKSLVLSKSSGIKNRPKLYHSTSLHHLDLMLDNGIAAIKGEAYVSGLYTAIHSQGNSVGFGWKMIRRIKAEYLANNSCEQLPEAMTKGVLAEIQLSDNARVLNISASFDFGLKETVSDTGEQIVLNGTTYRPQMVSNLNFAGYDGIQEHKLEQFIYDNDDFEPALMKLFRKSSKLLKLIDNGTISTVDLIAHLLDLDAIIVSPTYGDTAYYAKEVVIFNRDTIDLVDIINIFDVQL